MKTISLDHPVRVYFKDGECYHDSATIMIANGFPSFVRGRGPDVIYPWENVKHIIRVAEEPAEPDTTERLRASIADERNRAKQEVHAKVARVQALHTEHRQMLRAALGLRDDEANDNVTGDFKALCELVVIMREVREPKHLRRALESAEADLASVTEQRDVLKRQIEELRAEMRKPVLSQPKQVEPGGPIWVRVVDTTSKHFGLVGRLMGIEQHTSKGECWGVDIPDLNGKDHAWNRAEAFAVIGTGRQGPGLKEAPKPDVEHKQAQNRDKWRATCLANGAKDCTVFFGPGDGVTVVVELKHGYDLNDMRRALASAHNLGYDQYSIREVRPGLLAKMRTASEP